jgi:P-type conjugative transfer protein TrbL
MGLEDIYTPYFDASQHYTAIITPYAVHLLYVLILLELTTIGLTWMAGSNDDPPEILWRLVRLIFTGGFAYWWIYNAWTLGMIVIGSFNQLGVVLTGQPGLTAIAFLRSALRLSQLLFSAPGASGLLPDLALRIEEFLLSNVIFLVFLIVAALALFTITAGYIILAGGIIIVPFLACRFTSSLGEGYFTWIVKTGVVIFFFYLVLGIAESFVGRWGTGVAAICGAKAGISLPSPLLGAAPVAAPVLTCTVPIVIPDLLRLLADCVILAFIAVGVPFTAGAIVSHGVNAAVEHFAAAKYLAGSAVKPVARSITNATQRAFHKSESQSRSTLEQRLAAGAAAKNPPRQSQIATQRLPHPPAINSFGVQRTQALPNGNEAKPTSKI